MSDIKGSGKKASTIKGKIVKGLKYSLYVFCCLAAIFGYWILFTGNAIQTAINTVPRVSQVQLSATVTEGSLYQGISIVNIDVNVADTRITVEQLALQWQPFALFSGELYFPYFTLDSVEVSLPEASGEETENQAKADTPLTIPADMMAGIPVLVIDQFKLDKLSIISAANETPFRLQQFDFKLNYVNGQYHLYDVAISNDKTDIKADAKLGVASPFQSNVNSQISITLDEHAPLGVDLKLQGNLNALTADINLRERLEANVVIHAKDIINNLQWDASINMDSVALRRIKSDLPDINVGIAVDATGDMTKLRGKGRVTVSDDGALSIAIDQEIETPAEAKTNNKVNFNLTFHAEKPNPEVFDGEVLIDWSELNWLLAEQKMNIHSKAGEVKLNRLLNHNTLTALTNLQINDIPLNLDLTLTNSGEHIAIEKLLVTSKEVEMNITGKFDQGSQELQLDSLWNIVDLAIPQIKERINSTGKASITGTLDNYALRSHLTASGLNIPKFDLSLPLKGNLNGVIIDNAELLTLNGKLSTSGDISWQDQLSLNFNWQGDDFNPGALWTDWQGKIASKGEIGIIKTEDVLQWTLQPSTLYGSLRNLPLSLNLSGHSVNEKSNNIAVEGLYANAAVSIHGEVGDKLNLNWQLGSSDLSQVYPELGGNLSSDGQLTGSADTPKIKAKVSGKNIFTPWASSEAVAADINADLSLDAMINADITLKNVTYATTSINDLEIKVDGRNSQHQFSIQSSMPDLEVRLAGEGALQNKSWTGLLSTLEVEHETYKKWQLNQTATVSVSPDLIRLQALCLMQSAASVCTDLSLQRLTQQWEVNANASEISLNYLQQNVPETLTLNGHTQAQLHLAGKAERPITGQGSFSIPRGHVDIAITDDVIKTIPLDQTLFEFKLENGFLTGSGELPASGADIKTLKTHFQLGDFRQKDLAAENLNINAELQAGIADLSLVSAIAPQIIEVKGSLDIDLLFKDRLSHPIYDGKVILSNAGFSSPDLGIQIKNMGLQGNKLLENQFEIKGEMQSGNGTLNLKTIVELEKDKELNLDINLKGEQFEVVNLPELWALVSPDISGKWSSSNESFQGALLIPEATINLDEVVVSSSTSQDEFIVNEQIEAETAAINRKINIKVILGQAVVIKGKGISGNLVGELALSTNKKGETIGNGEILIDKGKYSAYGQDLVIKEGRLIYRNAALDDPVLSIVAVREVDGITVGLKVSGYITNPEVSLFSSKSLPQEQIISYIVFGRPLSSLSSSEGSDLIGAAANLGLRNSGLITEKVASTFGLDEFTVGGASAQSASVSVGKYLNPKLYLSYGLGIFDKLSTVRLRYELSKRFSIETESGSEMGADIFYRIER